MGYFENLFLYEWEMVESPAGAKQWRPKDGAASDVVVDAHDPSKRHAPMMHTTDLALRFDPVYAQISRRFWEHPEEFADAFARAWYKLTHRDMGPWVRGVGALKPSEQLWQDPVPAVTHALVSNQDVVALKAAVMGSGLSIGDLVFVAWSSAATFRATDKRGGANGGRIRLAQLRAWEVNDPSRLERVLSALDAVKERFNTEHAALGVSISMADLIVLAGVAAVEHAAAAAGHPVEVAFRPGRTDADEAFTDEESFAWLEPTFDGFRNYVASWHAVPAEKLLLERARLLGLSAPEMTVLVGGMRVLDANHACSSDGVFTDRPGVLSQDFFTNLLDMATTWRETDSSEQRFEGRDRHSGDVRWYGSRVDLVFGSNSQLRALAEVYACDDAAEKFVRDFAAAWVKVMELDRFDLPHSSASCC
jgi:catalase-peroxidase